MDMTKDVVQTAEEVMTSAVTTAKEQSMEPVAGAEETMAEELDKDSSTKPDSMNFENEMNYAAAREIMNTLMKQNLLTEEEVNEIDAFLQEKFSPVFASLIAKYPAF